MTNELIDVSISENKSEKTSLLSSLQDQNQALLNNRAKVDALSGRIATLSRHQQGLLGQKQQLEDQMKSIQDAIDACSNKKIAICDNNPGKM